MAAVWNRDSLLTIFDLIVFPQEDSIVPAIIQSPGHDLTTVEEKQLGYSRSTGAMFDSPMAAGTKTISSGLQS